MRLKPSLQILAAALFPSLLAAPVLARGATPSPSPAPSPSPSPGPPPTTPPGARPQPGTRPPAAPPEVHLRADAQERLEKGHYLASGRVDLQAGDTRVLCDQMDLFEEEQPDGTKRWHLVAEGNVVFMRGDERLAGDKMDLDLNTGHGIFTNAMGFVQPGVFVEASSIERVDSETYRMEGAKFTSCAQPNPRWSFSASSATIHIDDKLVAHNVALKVKAIPVLYFPVFVFPISEDQRHSGLLFPNLGTSSVRGFDVGLGFFWAMGRSFDQTFYVDHYSLAGWGYGHDLRWALDAGSRGDIRTYLYEYSPEFGGTTDYDLNWTLVQMLPWQLRVNAKVLRFSNIAFQQSVQYSLNQISNRNQSSSINIQRTVARLASVQFTVDNQQTFFGDQSTGPSYRVNGHLPTLRVYGLPKTVGPLVVSFDARAEYLSNGDQTKVNRYSRFDFAPQVSAPLALPWLQIEPRLGFRETHYGASLENSEDSTDYISAPLNRRFFEAGIDLTGPVFSRVFTNPGHWYSDKFKHVISPEITFDYRSHVDNFDEIPKFDGIDQYLGTSQLTYGIVQRLLARRTTPGRPDAKPVPYEFLTWTLTQTYYFNIANGQNEFDPNYSSDTFGPGGVPDHNSPILSRLRLRPSPAFSVGFDAEYDVNFKQFRTFSVTGALNQKYVSMQGGWSQASLLAVDPQARQTVRNTLRGAAHVEPVPKHITLEGSVDYDAVLKQFYRAAGRFRYDVQCCGFMVELIDYNYNLRKERVLNFQIQLANIGSIGNFFGDDPRLAGVFPTNFGNLR